MLRQLIILMGGGEPSVGVHRYWRIVDLDIPSAFLQISELQVLEAHVDVTSSATKTSSTPPDVNGALSNLFDGNLNNNAAWSAAVAEDPAFWIKFDFGAGNDTLLSGMKQGGFDTADRYMAGFTIQYSDDNSNWTQAATFSGLTYPGNNTLSSEYTFP